MQESGSIFSSDRDDPAHVPHSARLARPAERTVYDPFERCPPYDIRKRFDDSGDSADEKEVGAPSGMQMGFSRKEHERLLDAVFMLGTGDFGQVAQMVGTRSWMECFDYWERLTAMRPMIEPKRPNKMFGMSMYFGRPTRTQMDGWTSYCTD